jgi:hypothetical protein
VSLDTTTGLLPAAIAVSAGVLAFALLTLRIRAYGGYAYALDFTPHWRAVDALRRGYSPYEVINGFSTLYPFGAGYLNVLPAALLLYPFAWASPEHAAAIFNGIAVGLFAYACARTGRLPLLLSAPVFFAAKAAQTTPLVTAAMVVPSLGFLAPIKFTTGLAGAAYNLNKRYIIGAGLVCFISIIFFPWWPIEWWHERTDMVATYYHVPLLVTGGLLVLLALMKVRQPEARLLAVMACLPQTMLFYDQLPLTLVARTFRESLIVSLASWVGPCVAIVVHGSGPITHVAEFAENAPIIVCSYYLPCLALVLLRGANHNGLSKRRPFGPLK